jgi:hypothetical protein
MHSHWRNEAKRVINEVLQQTNGQSERDIKKALCEAYPFGVRKYHPYKIWLDEIARQRGIKKKKKSKSYYTQLEMQF